jgi:cell division septum initiation protein DivIVA
MDLDPQTIEKRDFPIGRRGYDTAAVDGHLEAIAREVEALKRQSRSRRGESLASAASAQVQAIVEAAETSAADIERQAQMDAARIRQDAQREADRTRDEAVEHSRDHVSKVSEATAVMLQRVDAMEGELGALFESLRTGANRLSADLSLLEGNMGELYAAAGGTRRGSTVVPVAPEAAASQEEEMLAEEVETLAEEVETLAEAVAVEEVLIEAAEEELEEEAERAESQPEFETADDYGEQAGSVTEARPGEASDDVEGARLIALNMALNGQSREEADRYLADNFDLADRVGLLDEVYASVEG